MTLVLAAFGLLGVSFGRLGAMNKHASGSAPAFSPSLDFSDGRNSQYLMIGMI